METLTAIEITLIISVKLDTLGLFIQVMKMINGFTIKTKDMNEFLTIKAHQQIMSPLIQLKHLLARLEIGSDTELKAVSQIHLDFIMMRIFILKLFRSE